LQSNRSCKCNHRLTGRRRTGLNPAIGDHAEELWRARRRSAGDGGQWSGDVPLRRHCSISSPRPGPDDDILFTWRPTTTSSSSVWLVPAAVNQTHAQSDGAGGSMIVGVTRWTNNSAVTQSSSSERSSRTVVLGRPCTQQTGGAYTQSHESSAIRSAGSGSPHCYRVVLCPGDIQITSPRPRGGPAGRPACWAHAASTPPPAGSRCRRSAEQCRPSGQSAASLVVFILTSRATNDDVWQFGQLWCAGYNYDSTSIYDCSSTALRPFDDIRYDRAAAYLDLDLVPPVPDGTLGDEISPPVSIVGSSPCTMPS